jgi:hypothetical protein
MAYNVNTNMIANEVNYPLSKKKSSWPAILTIKINKNKYVGINIVSQPSFLERKQYLHLSKKMMQSLIMILPSALETVLGMEKMFLKEDNTIKETSTLLQNDNG